MLLHGDELGRTQDGNNNTYAQDSEIAWMHWDDVDEPLVEFTAAVARLRRDHPTFRRKRFFTGTTVRTGDGERLNDIVWLHLDGRPMEDGDWDAPAPRSIGMYLNGHGIAGHDARGSPIIDDHFLLYFNADGRRRTAHPAAGGVRRGVGRRDRHRRRRRRRARLARRRRRSHLDGPQRARAPRAHARPRPSPTTRSPPRSPPRQASRPTASA